MATEAPTNAVWVRRCRGCGRDDLAAAFGQASMITGPWVCPACGSRRHDPHRLPLPGATPSGACPHVEHPERARRRLHCADEAP